MSGAGRVGAVGTLLVGACLAGLRSVRAGDGLPGGRLVSSFDTGVVDQTGAFSGVEGTSGRTRVSSRTWELALAVGVTIQPRWMLLATAGVNLPFPSTLIGNLGMRRAGAVARVYPWLRHGWYAAAEADYVAERWQGGSLATLTVDQSQHFNGLRVLATAGWTGALPSADRGDAIREDPELLLPDEPVRRGFHFDTGLRLGTCALWSAKSDSVWLLDVGVFVGILWY